MKINVHNLIILDESGSMQSIHKAAVDGLNETLQSIQYAQEAYGETQEHYVTAVFFNSNSIRTVVDNSTIGQTKMLQFQDFMPTSSTPLYDAMGVSLSRLRYKLDENAENRVLVTIITDGEENASKEYSGKMIRRMVDELKREGWTFAYIGANQDVVKVADTLSINNAMCFEASEKGSRRMAQKLSRSRSTFYGKICENLIDPMVNLQENFFKGED